MFKLQKFVFWLGLYRNLAHTPVEIQPFSQIRLKSGPGKNLDRVSGFSQIFKNAMYLTKRLV